MGYDLKCTPQPGTLPVSDSVPLSISLEAAAGSWGVEVVQWWQGRVGGHDHSGFTITTVGGGRTTTL